MSKTFYQQVSALQRQLNAPKNQYNTFGKYRYRSCEDILEGIKPLLGDLFLSISDEIVLIGHRNARIRWPYRVPISDCVSCLSSSLI